MRNHQLIRARAILIMTLIFIFIVPIRQVSAMSTGCDALNQQPLSIHENFMNFSLETYAITLTGNNSTPRLEYEAGDIITWDLSSSFPEGTRSFSSVIIFIRNSSASIADVFFINSAFSQSLSQSGLYTILEDGSYNIQFYLSSAMQDINQVNLNFNVSCESPSSSVPVSPDDRVNWGYGDLYTVAYSPLDTDGNHQLVVYCWDDVNQSAWLGFAISQADINALTSDTTQLIASVSNGTCQAAFYVLNTGGYQLNISTPDGQIYQLIDTDLNFHDAIRLAYNPRQ